jgi:membrane-bound ClpP family serine protease
MTLALVIILFLVGIVLLLLEVLVTPGFVIGLVGLVFMGFGVYLVYDNYGDSIGNWVAGITIFSVIASVILALKSGVWNRVSLVDTISYKMNIIDALDLGEKGKAISALRPSGNAIFRDKKVEVTTLGESVDSGSEIEIIELRQNKIIVKQVV